MQDPLQKCAISGRRRHHKMFSQKTELLSMIKNYSYLKARQKHGR